MAETEKQPLTREWALDAWAQVQHLIEVGAYEERSSYHHESGTWPEDGVEETAFGLEEWAARQDLEFSYNHDTHIWSLVPMSAETRAARLHPRSYEEIETELQELREQEERQE